MRSAYNTEKDLKCEGEKTKLWNEVNDIFVNLNSNFSHKIQYYILIMVIYVCFFFLMFSEMD